MPEPKPSLLAKLKRGVLLKYKKRFFKSNWRESQVTLFSNATIVSCDGPKSRETVIQMAKQTTLIIFGNQLKDVPKKPILPSGYRIDQLLAIGLIHSATQKAGDGMRGRMSIVFHWFIPLTIYDLVDWIVAINNSIPDNKQILTDDDLTMSLVMAEAAHYNQMMMLQQQQTHILHDSGLEGCVSSVFNESGMADVDQSNFHGLDVETFDDYYNDIGADMNFGCCDVDNGTAFAAADAFAIF